MITPNPFDQMVTGSMLGGYTATIKSTPPASHLYVTAGVQPCAGFYHAVEVTILVNQRSYLHWYHTFGTGYFCAQVKCVR